MKVLITGSPCAGKTTVAKELGKQLDCSVVNEKDFAVEKGIAEFDEECKEYVIEIKEIERELNKFLEGEKNVIIEGHVVCGAKLEVDLVVVLRVKPEELERRLEKEGYNAVKIADNVFCEREGYCKKHAVKNYHTVVEIENTKDLKETVANIIREIRKTGKE